MADKGWRSQYPAEHFLLPGRQEHLEDKYLWRTRLLARLHVVDVDRPPRNYDELRGADIRDSHWLWTGARETDGRAVARVSGRKRSVPRVMWTLYRKGTDIRRVIHRTCDDPRCVNPWHAEMVARGSWQRKSGAM